MTSDRTTVSALRPVLDRLASKWTFKLSDASENRHLFFGGQLSALLKETADADLAAAAEVLADNWGNAGVGVPESHGYVRGYFSFDVKQAMKASRTA
ncbi:hypothetical protein [Arthrobacter sp. UYCo732]|uniref:hypothetical protein n=1 Tax=Arthrobacter sp. UYCo732 TaxID=3156336 RepID=UPI0033931C43